MGIAAMTVAAFGRSVGTDKREARGLAVVKLCLFPALHRMALLAINPKPALMDVLDCVAVIAGR